MITYKGTIAQTDTINFTFKVKEDASAYEIEQMARSAALEQLDWSYDDASKSKALKEVCFDTAADIVISGHNNAHAENPCNFSTANWILWEFGAWLARSGIAAPETVKDPEGYSVTTEGGRYSWFRDENQRAIFKKAAA